MICFFHKSDLDGHCSGAIVRYKFPHCRMQGVGHDDENLDDMVEHGEEVFMVDFSRPEDEMLRIYEKASTNFSWMDHHKTIPNLPQIKGTRREGDAGCLLTWEYLYPNAGVPTGVRMLSEYDVWRHTEIILDFQYGMRNYDTYPTSIAAMMGTWEPVFERNNGFLLETLKIGKILHTKTNKDNMIGLKALKTFFEWEGYSCCGANLAISNSKVFDTLEEPVDIMVTFGWRKDKWKVSIYTNKDIDVSKIAKKYGGGGHGAAAGFFCDELPFKLVGKE